MKRELRTKLQKLVKMLNKNGAIAELGDDTYLIRYSTEDFLAETGDGLRLMSDFGITWEPSRAYRTPCYGMIDINDLDNAVVTMMEILHNYVNRKLSKQC